MDHHFIKECLKLGNICTPFVKTDDQLAFILTKGLTSTQFSSIVNKMGMWDLYSPTWGGVLEITYIAVDSSIQVYGAWL